MTTNHRTEAERLLTEELHGAPTKEVTAIAEVGQGLALLAIHDLLAERLPKTTPQEPQDAPQAAAQPDQAPAHPDAENGLENATQRLLVDDDGNGTPTLWLDQGDERPSPLWQRTDNNAEAFDIVTELVRAEQEGRVADEDQAVVDRDDLAYAVEDCEAAMEDLDFEVSDDYRASIAHLRAALERGDRG